MSWSVSPGDIVSEFDPLCTVQSDKASVDITSRFEGKVLGPLSWSVGDMVSVGSVLVELEVVADGDAEKDEQAAVAEKASPEAPSPPPPPPDRIRGLAIPSVRRLAAEHGLDLSEISGTGKEGRILKTDVLEMISDDASEPTSGADDGADVMQMSGLHRVMFDTMTASLSIPTLHFTEKIRIDAVLGLKTTHPAKPTVTAFMLRALGLALSKHTNFNSIYASNGQWLKRDLRLGCAMDTPRGLLVASTPLGDLSFLSNELRRLGELASDNRVGKEDLVQPTFTLSNVGALGGGVHANPVLPPPLTAMCAMGSAQVEPVWDDATAEGPTKGTFVYVTFAADHRVHDGASVVRLSNDVKSFLESPLTMM